VYSFRDVVGLRALAQLRRQVPLQQLRKLGNWLKQHYETPWSSLRFSVGNGRVYFYEPETGQRVAARPFGQYHLPVIELEDIARDTSRAASRLRDRAPAEIGQVARNRYVMSNAPVLAGTRVPTSAIWHFHRAGYTTEAILRQYPRLTAEDVRAALAHEEGLQERRVG
jgi:uncharacterized protein (DUF433 family)